MSRGILLNIVVGIIRVYILFIIPGHEPSHRNSHNSEFSDL